MSNQKPQFRRPTVPASPNPDLDDPMWWLARDLEAARERNRARVENRYGLGQWEALDEARGQRGLPLDVDPTDW